MLPALLERQLNSGRRLELLNTITLSALGQAVIAQQSDASKQQSTTVVAQAPSATRPELTPAEPRSTESTAAQPPTDETPTHEGPDSSVGQGLFPSMDHQDGRQKLAPSHPSFPKPLHSGALQTQFGTRAPYCPLNQQVPVVLSDLRPDFRLNRQTLTYLINTLREDRDHGWGQDLEILVFIFCLASATSYRVVCRAFDMPRSTVHMIVHKVSKLLLRIKRKVTHFPSLEELEEISTGFANLAGSPVFSSIAGAGVMEDRLLFLLRAESAAASELDSREAGGSRLRTREELRRTRWYLVLGVGEVS
ncbi:hypothetical protein G5714_004208 [Onychostoma macrolepis]|uniref:Uncharacterized protein n=1 Tax=Onychostoma macrolepis TaxID=369639 RepID=A0A7J6DBX4_9TELE|nr:hypothetical protein G5714_004208 [Onychostoma macrolepis]